MKVNIQYGVDIDEVPKKISSLINRALISLEEKIKITKSLSALCEKGLYLSAVESGLDEIRKQLALTDADLANAHAITSGLVQHLSAEPSQAAATPVPTPPPTADILSEKAQSELESMTEMLQQVEEKINESKQQLNPDKG